jgi:hypothetical protein
MPGRQEKPQGLIGLVICPSTTIDRLRNGQPHTAPLYLWELMAGYEHNMGEIAIRTEREVRLDRRAIVDAVNAECCGPIDTEIYHSQFGRALKLWVSAPPLGAELLLATCTSEHYRSLTGENFYSEKCSGLYMSAVRIRQP